MYRLRPLAQQDIKQIYKTSKQTFGQLQADHYYSELFGAFRKLDDRPDSGTDYASVHPDLRGLRMQSHIIFYMTTTSGEIDIVRILHRRMDYHRHLS
jgi:toxin ParE1/3/4